MGKKKKCHPFNADVQSLHTKNGKIYVCTCGGEALAIDQWEHHDEMDCVSMSMWRCGHYKADWRTQLRMIWHVIKNGHPYTDEICLSRYQAESIGKLLTKLSKNKPKKEDKHG
jgi:hypothetical protein